MRKQLDGPLKSKLGILSWIVFIINYLIFFAFYVGESALESQRISSNPLLKHKTTCSSVEMVSDVNQESAVNPVTNSTIERSKESSKIRVASCSDKPITISNTSKIKEDKHKSSSFAVFNDKEIMNSSKSSLSTSFAILSDEAPKSQSVKPIKQKTSSIAVFSEKEEIKSSLQKQKMSSSSSSSSFAIFNDDNKEKIILPNQPSSSYVVFNDMEEIKLSSSQTIKQKYTSSSSFAIFNDDNKEDKKLTKPPSSASFAIYNDNNTRDVVIIPSKSNKQPLSNSHIDPVINEEDHDQQLQDMILQLGILDGEDGTINTRLARKDIDSMFCSPSSDMRTHEKHINANSNNGYHNENLYSSNNANDANGELSAIIDTSRDHSLLVMTLATPGFNIVDR